jgi:hypothetical protein
MTSVNNTTDYEDEDYNLKLYETKTKVFTQSNYVRIRDRLNGYKTKEIPSRQQDELIDRLLVLATLYEYMI